MINDDYGLNSKCGIKNLEARSQKVRLLEG